MNIQSKRLAIVFTDLDGCLLDHDTYDHRPALAALMRLSCLKIPVIPVTSKTMDEIAALTYQFGPVPHISENGMVIESPQGFLPPPHDGPVRLFAGKRYKEIVAFLNQLPGELRAVIHGFNDMTDEEVASFTGLALPAARRARSRQASEPFLWRGDDAQYERLVELSSAGGFTLTRGGRFHHILSKGSKADAVTEIMKLIVAAYPQCELTTIALGDSENDREMLANADIGIVVPKIDGSVLNVDASRGRMITAPEPGPVGWGLAVTALLEELQYQRPQTLNEARAGQA